MKATVFIDPETEEPTTLKGQKARDEVANLYGPYADYDVVSEHSLEVAVWALQQIMSSSACPGSRRTAEQALKAIGMGGDMPTTPGGLPMPVKLKPHQLDPHFLGNPWAVDTAS